MLKFITDFSAFNARDTVKNVNVEIKKSNIIGKSLHIM